MIRESAIRCEKPQGVVMQPGRVNAGGKVVTMFLAPESGTSYMRIAGADTEAWFRVVSMPVCARVVKRSLFREFASLFALRFAICLTLAVIAYQVLSKVL